VPTSLEAIAFFGICRIAEASLSEEPSAVIPHAGIRAGGGRATALPTATPEGGCGDCRPDGGPYHRRQVQRRQAQGRLGAGHGLPPVLPFGPCVRKASRSHGSFARATIALSPIPRHSPLNRQSFALRRRTHPRLTCRVELVLRAHSHQPGSYRRCATDPACPQTRRCLCWPAPPARAIRPPLNRLDTPLWSWYSPVAI